MCVITVLFTCFVCVCVYCFVVSVCGKYVSLFLSLNDVYVHLLSFS